MPPRASSSSVRGGKLSDMESKFYQAALSSPNSTITQDDLSERFKAVPLEEQLAVINGLLKKNLFSVQKSGDSIQYLATAKTEASMMGKLDDNENIVYSHIKDARNEGIWTKQLKIRTGLHQTIINRCLKSLEQKQLVKVVKSVKYPTRKIYMLFGLTPSTELSGGPWYTDNELDTGFIVELSMACLNFIRSRSFPKNGQSRALFPSSHTSKLPSAATVHAYLRNSGLTETQLELDHVVALLDILVFDEQIEKIPVLPFSMGGSGGSGGRATNGYGRDLDGDSDSDSGGGSGSDDDSGSESNSGSSSGSSSRSDSASDDDDDDDSDDGSASSGSESDAVGSKKRKRSSKSSSRSRKRGKKESSSSSSKRKSSSRTKSKGRSDSRGKSKSKSKSGSKGRSASSSSSKSKPKRSSNSSSSHGGKRRPSSRSKRSSKERESKSRSRSRSRSKSRVSSGSSSDSDSDSESRSDRSRSRSRSASPRVRPSSSDEEGTNAALNELDGATRVPYVYRAVRPLSVRVGWTEVPCGHCPVFDFCDESGPVNAESCQYFGGVEDEMGRKVGDGWVDVAVAEEEEEGEEGQDEGDGGEADKGEGEEAGGLDVGE